jgi:hypothetical protein
VRLTGVAVSGLVSEPARQGDLFADAGAAERERRQRLNRALDAITERFGDAALVPADLTGRRRR